MKRQVIYVMGVSGSGKTLIGKLLSKQLGIPFYDADDFHPEVNRYKMGRGIPLTDEDRADWLKALHVFVTDHLVGKGSLVLACSALKEHYRQQLAKDLQNVVRWVVLNGSFALIQERIQARTGHYMPASLLTSQFEALELPEYGLHLDIDNSPEAIAREAFEWLKADG